MNLMRYFIHLVLAHLINCYHDALRALTFSASHCSDLADIIIIIINIIICVSYFSCMQPTNKILRAKRSFHCTHVAVTRFKILLHKFDSGDVDV